MTRMKNYKEEFHQKEKSETMVFYGNFNPNWPILSVSLSHIYPLLNKNSSLQNLCFNCFLPFLFFILRCFIRYGSHHPNAQYPLFISSQYLFFLSLLLFLDCLMREKQSSILNFEQLNIPMLTTLKLCCLFLLFFSLSGCHFTQLIFPKKCFPKLATLSIECTFLFSLFSSSNGGINDDRSLGRHSNTMHAIPSS